MRFPNHPWAPGLRTGEKKKTKKNAGPWVGYIRAGGCSRKRTFLKQRKCLGARSGFNGKGYYTVL